MLLTGDVTMVTCRLSCLSLEVKYQVNLISDDNCRILVYFSKTLRSLYYFFFKKGMNTLYFSIYLSCSIIKQDGKLSKIKAVLLQLVFEFRYQIRYKSVAVKNNNQEMLLQKSGKKKNRFGSDCEAEIVEINSLFFCCNWILC